MVEVVAHVVAAERQHGERIAPHHALLADGGGGGFRAHGGGHVDAFDPAAGLGHQRHGGGAAAAEDEGVDHHALRVLPLGVDRRALRRRGGETRVGMGGLATGLAGDGRGPVLALPVDQVRGRRVGHAFPPDVAVVGQGDVGEDDVGLERGHGVEVGLLAGARGHAEIAGLGVDGVQAAVGARLDPGDVVADGGHLPAVHALRRDQHGEVGLAAGRRERGGDVVLAALGRGHAQDQHVFGQPALVAAHGGGDAQREALLAEQRIAAVARTEAPDLAALGEVDDVLGGVAGPGHVGLAGGQRLADRVHARHEVAVGAQHVVDLLAHARHDAHVDRDIRAVGQLDADVGDVRTQRPHRERHHVQRAAAHGAVEQAVERRAHLGRVGPVVGRTGVLGTVGADEGAVFDARHVRRVGTGQEGIGPLGRVEPAHGAGLDHQFAQAIVFFLRTVAPFDAIRFGQRHHTGDPVDQAAVLDVRGYVQGRQAPVQGLIH
ncbi:Uncharacterised protein [Achromobacter sp. 2789STDY5608615]|nr:Uncharacterised protein [Achromobacter sp. 2789STDY5608615]